MNRFWRWVTGQSRPVSASKPSNPHEPYSEEWLMHEAQHGERLIDRQAASATLRRLWIRRDDEERLRRIIREEIHNEISRAMNTRRTA